MAGRSGNAFAVQALLRHKDITTSRGYVHDEMTVNREALSVIPDVTGDKKKAGQATGTDGKAETNPPKSRPKGVGGSCKLSRGAGIRTPDTRIMIPLFNLVTRCRVTIF